MKRKGFGLRKKFIAAGLAVALLLGISPSAQAYIIPVIDAANLVENYVAAIQQYIDTATTIYQWYEMLREGQYFSFLMSLLNTLGMKYPATDVGKFASEVLEAHDAWMGVADYGVATRDKVNALFGGALPLPQDDPRYLLIDAMDASATRTVKEVGQFRAERDTREQRMKEIQNKANGTTGVDRQMQLANTTLANVYGAIVDQSMFISTTNELLSTQVEIQRERTYREQVINKWAREGLVSWLDTEAQNAAVPKIALP